MTIEAKLAQVLTNVTAAINVGSDDGVNIGDVAVIANLIEVTDPVTQEVLGSVAVDRVRTKVISVQERVSVVKVTDTYKKSDSRYLKTMTEDLDMEDYSTVFVRRGDHVTVEEETEPPF